MRELERRVRDFLQPAPRKSPTDSRVDGGTTRGPAVLRRIEDGLRQRLQTDVKIHLTGPERGNVEIAFYSADDLERLLDVVLGPNRERQ